MGSASSASKQDIPVGAEMPPKRKDTLSKHMTKGKQTDGRTQDTTSQAQAGESRAGGATGGITPVDSSQTGAGSEGSSTPNYAPKYSTRRSTKNDMEKKLDEKQKQSTGNQKGGTSPRKPIAGSGGTTNAQRTGPQARRGTEPRNSGTAKPRNQQSAVKTRTSNAASSHNPSTKGAAKGAASKDSLDESGSQQPEADAMVQQLEAKIAQMETDFTTKERKLTKEVNEAEHIAREAQKTLKEQEESFKDAENQLKKKLQIAQTNAKKAVDWKGEKALLEEKVRKLAGEQKDAEDKAKATEQKLQERNKQLNIELTRLKEQARTRTTEKHNAETLQAMLQVQVEEKSWLEEELKTTNERKLRLEEQLNEANEREKGLMEQNKQLEQGITDIRTTMKEETKSHKEKASKQNAELQQVKGKVDRMDKDYNSLLEARISQDPNNQNLNDKWRVARVLDLYKELRDNKRLDFMDDLEKSGYKDESKLPLLRVPSIVLMECFQQAELTIASVFEDVKGAVKKVLKRDTQVNSLDRVFTEVKVLLKSHMADLNTEAFKKQVAKNLEAKLKQGKDVHKFLVQTEIGKQFMGECLVLGSAMAMQHPAMFPVTSDSTTPTPGDTVYDQARHTLFSECKAADGKISYFVWPALVGSNGIDILEKGVVFTTK